MIIQSKRVWVLGQWLEAQVEVEEGKIKEILPYGSRPADKDYGDKRVVPGFIDIHTHGAYGFDTNDAEEEGLRNWMKNIPEEGVTGILPTTITQSEEVLTKAVANVAKVVEEGYEGAEILGIHFEGPYLDQVYKGAQPEQYCVAPDVEQFKRYQKAANGLIKVVTMAPEHDEGFQLLHYLNDTGVTQHRTFRRNLRGGAHGHRQRRPQHDAHLQRHDAVPSPQPGPDRRSDAFP